MISANWQQLVKERQVDPVNPAPLHNGKKRKASHPSRASASHSARAQRSGPTSLPLSTASPATTASPLPLSSSLPSQPTLLIAMDCEMVGIGATASEHALARCSIVNSLGAVLYDRYVQPTEPVTDYRTAVSGIQPHHILPTNAITFSQCQGDVAALLARRILIGHALHSDLAALQLSHPRRLTRDTSRWKGLCPHRPRALRVLAEEQLGVAVQSGQHDSVEDARTALQLYLQHRKQWELDIRRASQPRLQQHQRSNGDNLAQHHAKLPKTQQSSTTSSHWSSEGATTATATATGGALRVSGTTDTCKRPRRR